MPPKVRITSMMQNMETQNLHLLPNSTNQTKGSPTDNHLPSMVHLAFPAGKIMVRDHIKTEVTEETCLQ